MSEETKSSPESIPDDVAAENDATLREGADETDIRDTDIVFDCPHCGKTLVIDYRGAGLQVTCSECGEPALVPIPEGMELNDLDLDAGEILKQLFATRRNYQKAELTIQALKARFAQLQETLSVMQDVVSEALAES